MTSCLLLRWRVGSERMWSSGHSRCHTTVTPNPSSAKHRPEFFMVIRAARGAMSSAGEGMRARVCGLGDFIFQSLFSDKGRCIMQDEAKFRDITTRLSLERIKKEFWTGFRNRLVGVSEQPALGKLVDYGCQFVFPAADLANGRSGLYEIAARNCGERAALMQPAGDPVLEVTNRPDGSFCLKIDMQAPERQPAARGFVGKARSFGGQASVMTGARGLRRFLAGQSE